MIVDSRRPTRQAALNCRVGRIGEFGLDLRPKLLRFLESGEICPLGDATPFTVDVRVIAATNANLEQAVKDGRFRDDLFYRLNVIRLAIPPLRERRDEIPGLVQHFTLKAATEFGKRDVRIGEDASASGALTLLPTSAASTARHQAVSPPVPTQVALASPLAVTLVYAPAQLLLLGPFIKRSPMACRL
jgi:sigma54-dependent transcription regulator